MGKKKKQEFIQINAPMAYVQAVEALYIAKKFALEQKDQGSLIDIANSWIEIGNHMLTNESEVVYSDEEAQTIHSEPEALIGFGFLGGPDGKKEAEPCSEPIQD